MAPPPIAVRVATEWLAARARWQPLEVAVLGRRLCRDLAVSAASSDPYRNRLARPVRALARPDPRLRRHHLARTRRLFRPRRLCCRATRQAWHRQRAGAGIAGRRPRRHGARFRHQLPGAARLGPHAPDGDARRRAGVARTGQPLRLADRRRRRAAGREHRAGARHVPLRHVRPHRLRLLPDRAVRSCS